MRSNSHRLFVPLVLNRRFIIDGSLDRAPSSCNQSRARCARFDARDWLWDMTQERLTDTKVSAAVIPD